VAQHPFLASLSLVNVPVGGDLILELQHLAFLDLSNVSKACILRRP
jgi:hypothetical protein